MSIIIQKEFNSSIERNVYLRLKKRIIEEEIKPLKRRIIQLEKETVYLKGKLIKMVNPSIKLFKSLKKLRDPN
jgi:predicted protein tyrosine phosphatase